MTTNRWLKVITAIWVIGYFVVACGPAIAADGIVGSILGAGIGLALGGALFVPWVVGLALLIGGIYLTRGSGRRSRDL